MQDDDSRSAVECTLSSEAAAKRAENLDEVLAGAYAGADELEDGYSIRFEGVDGTLLAVSRFVANERRCCAFADYRIELSPPYEETRLRFTGPDGTAELARGLVDRLDAESD